MTLAPGHEMARYARTPMRSLLFDVRAAPTARCVYLGPGSDAHGLYTFVLKSTPSLTS